MKQASKTRNRWCAVDKSKAGKRIQTYRGWWRGRGPLFGSGGQGRWSGKVTCGMPTETQGAGLASTWRKSVPHRRSTNAKAQRRQHAPLNLGTRNKEAHGTGLE